MIQQTLRQKAILHLEEAKKKENALISYYQLYQDLLQIQEEAAANITTSLDLVDEIILNERLRSGLPQLSFDLLAIDKTTFTDVVQEILSLLIAYQGEKLDIPLLPEEDLLAKARDRFLLTQSTDNPDLLVLAIDQALMPYLEHAAGQVMLHVDTKKWLRGNCPCCGAEPNFASLDSEGSRLLVCSRCRYQWRYKRTGCPYCGNTDPKSLRYYPAGEKKFYRLYVCDACNRYLKAVDQRIAGNANDLIAEPILTWSLDKAAREKGYR
jgi:formate dehydrogenase maturation protein FdhE